MSAPIHTLELTLDTNPSTLMWDYRFVLKKEWVEKHFTEKSKRVVCTYPGGVQKHCAILPMGEAGYFLMADKQLRKTLQIEAGDKIEVKIQRDESEYGMPMPEEFEACLAMEPEAADYFEKLTPGKKRSLIYMVYKIKNPEIKIRRALAILEHLKREKGALDFKLMNEVIKEFNQRENLP